MRKTLTGLVSLALLLGTATAAGAVGGAGGEPAPGAARGVVAGADIKDRVLAIPGMRLVEEAPYPGYRFFTFTYEQPVDHRDPGRGTFPQRFTLLHRDTSRPTVFHTGGYELDSQFLRSEPTRIIDGNEISLEHRFFSRSTPEPADWSKLTIRQAADDQHRLFTALKKIYDRKWIAAGWSKGGMTATYYERFHPRDMDGVVAYIAPNDVNDKEDSAYDRFFETVGTAECRDKLKGVQRKALVRREPLQKMVADWAAANGRTYDLIGSLDRAYEETVLQYTWRYWQAGLENGCSEIPDAATATDRQLFDSLDGVASFGSPSDQETAGQGLFQYHYQAGTELGSPRLAPAHLKDLLRYGSAPPRAFVPRDIPMTFEPGAMKDVDRWVRDNARQMLFVNGEYDPWSAEPFRLGKGARDSHVLTAPRTHHNAQIKDLTDQDRALATARVLAWAGVVPAEVRDDPSKAGPLAPYDATLDRPVAQRGGPRP